MFTTQRLVNVKNTIKPTECMFTSDRLVKAHFAENVMEDLNKCESELDSGGWVGDQFYHIFG